MADLLLGMAPKPLDIVVDSRTVSVSNPDKLLFPASGYSKADLARYYAAVAPVMVPLIADRPITLVRHPKGVESTGFFQKNTPDHYPEWIRRVELKKKGGVVRHCVVDEGAALVYFAQQNVITPHMGLARTATLDQPDLLAIDLDPSAEDFQQLRMVALAIKDLLERAGLVPFVQLTGSKGLHIVTPLTATTWSAVNRFGRALATKLLQRFPDDLTMEFSKAERGDRIYLDMGRNNYQATIACPYGVRAFEGAPVVTPITWPELEQPDIGPRSFSITTVPDRLAQQGDPWADLYTAAKPVPAA